MRLTPSVFRIFICVVSALSLTLSATAQDDLFVKRQASIQGIVVSETPVGMLGQAIDIIITVNPRDKNQTRFERAVGAQMTTSLNEAVRAVQVTHPQWDGTQLRVSFEDKYSGKDGGSAGTAYAVCIHSLLAGFDIDPGYAMTGDITVDQRVRKIGGVSAKIQGATADGAKIIGIPLENADALGDMILLDSLQPLLEAQVFTLDTLDQAIELARTDRDPLLEDAIVLFAELQESTGKGGYKRLRTPEAQATLEEIVELAPNHVSAEMLLRYTKNDGPRHLSVTGSLNEVLERGSPAFDVMDHAKPGQASKEQRDIMRSVIQELRALRGMTHPDVAELRDAMSSYAAAGNSLITARRPTNRHVKRYNSTLSTLIDTYNEVSEDPETLKALLRESQ